MQNSFPACNVPCKSSIGTTVSVGAVLVSAAVEQVSVRASLLSCLHYKGTGLFVLRVAQEYAHTSPSYVENIFSS